MKNLLTTTALTLALAPAAFAASHIAYTYGDGRAATAPVYGDAFAVDPNYAVDGYEMYDGELTADDLDDAQVYSTISGEMIGGVDDVLIENGNISAYVLEVGGFLGLGDTEVTVAADQVMLMRNPGLGDTRVYINATEEQLEAYPQYEYEAADLAVAPVDGDDTMMANDTTVVVTDADPVTPATETTPTDETVVVAQTDTMAEGAYMNRAGDPVAEPVFGDEFTVDPAFTVDGYEPYAGSYTDMLTEADVEEAPLYSAVTGEEIGEVEDALESNGVLSALVLDIGGFLGLGEHTITVAPDQVTYVRDPGLLSNVRVYINATEEQLKAYPSYNADL